MKQLLSLLVLLFAIIASSLANDIVESIDQESSTDVSTVTSALVTEKIEKISANKRIFIISNSNNSFSKGDFISLIYQNTNVVCRAVVAKEKDGNAGIRILKIYSEELWKIMRSGMEIQILRGDDSLLFVKQSKTIEKNTETIDDNENDLFNNTTISEQDIEFEENTNRHIKTDNIISVGYGVLDGLNNDGSSAQYPQMNGQWSYQLADNIWGEVLYGRNLIADYPADGIDTTLSNFVIRIKYTIAAPFYSYLKPFFGYQFVTPYCPGAGVGLTDPVLIKNEKDLVARLGHKGIIGGVTILKRMVPGWFMRADFGTDLLSGGLSMEF